MDWLDRADWRRRSPELGALVLRGDVYMELAAVPAQLWQLWRDLPRQTNILLAVGTDLVKYAAIDWAHERLAITDPTTTARAATWGLVLVRAYQHVAHHVLVQHRAWFAAPLVTFDLAGEMRIGFVAAKPDRLPPETLDQWPLCDDRALVHVIAQTLVELCVEIPPGTHLGNIVGRALDRDPARRYGSLGELATAFQHAGAQRIPDPALPRPPAWSYIEPAIGYLLLGEPERALDELAHALRYEPRLVPVLELRDFALRSAKATPARPPRPAPMTTEERWDDALRAGAALEQRRDFEGALVIYQRAAREPNIPLALALAIARCSSAIENFEQAIVYARVVIGAEPAHRDAHAILTQSLLRLRRHDDALTAADAWLAAMPDDARGIYARGKALLGLHRVVEARDAFDRACALDPQLVEAMWLRTVADRSRARLRAAVGAPVPMPVDLPAGKLRDALIAGRVDEGIQLLWNEPAPSDQLLLGELLLFAARFDEALRVFAGIAGGEHHHAALAGRARALFDLGRTDEALAVLDAIGGSDGFTAIRR